MLKKTKVALFSATLFAANPGLAGAADKPFDGILLRVLSTQQPWDAAIQKLAPRFEEETGAKLEFDLYAFNQAVQKVAIELSSSSPAYDVVFLEASDIQRFAAGKRLVAMDEYIKADKDYAIEDILPSVLKANKIDDVQYVMPYFAATQLMYYRLDLLQKAGVNAPPKTFAEFMDVCAKVQSVETPCTTLRGKAGASENVWYWTQIFYGYGGRFVKDFPKDMTPTVNTPEAVQALEVYKTLLTKYAMPGSASAGYDEVVVAMQQGNVAMVVDGAPLAGRILDPALSKVGGKLGFAVPPGGPKGTFAPFTSQGWGVNAASKNKAAAAAFILWATNRTTVREVTLNSSFLAVTRRSLWIDPDFKKKHGYDFGAGSFTEAYAKALELADKDYRLPIKDFRPMADRVGLALQEAVVGKKSSQQALDDAQKDIMTMFKRSGLIK